MTLPPAPDRWTIEQANGERMEAIAAFGFTERQARFLLNVLLHSGVFVERQYSSFASHRRPSRSGQDRICAEAPSRPECRANARAERSDEPCTVPSTDRASSA